MYDQLRHDYLSCAGHKTLHTPNMDRLAAMGVRFANTYVQSPVCGASRMSFYTGRYVSSHGAAWNNFPLKVGEQTLSDHLRKISVDSWLIGKTHMKADAEGMDRLGISVTALSAHGYPNADSIFLNGMMGCGQKDLRGFMTKKDHLTMNI